MTSFAILAYGIAVTMGIAAAAIFLRGQARAARMRREAFSELANNIASLGKRQ